MISMHKTTTKARAQSKSSKLKAKKKEKKGKRRKSKIKIWQGRRLIVVAAIDAAFDRPFIIALIVYH